MYKFVIDTDSEKLSSVNVYADKDKTKRIAAPLDAVGRFAQTVEVAFIGSRKPTAADTLQLVVSWDGTIDSILQSSDEAPQRAYIAHAGTPLEGDADTWTFPVRFESAALEAALAKRSKITLRGAVVVENEAAGTHVEYHFSVGAAASIFAGALADPQTAPVEFARVQRMSWADYQTLGTIDPDVIYVVADAPDAITMHVADTDAHKELFDKVNENIKKIEQQCSESESTLCTKVPLLETVPPAGNNNANGYGYVGTLRNLSAFGGSVLVSRISVFTRINGYIENGDAAVWARILKIVDGAWVVAAQSANSAKWNDYGFNAEIPFEMQAVPGIPPPSADETIAIVFVNSASAAAGTSNGLLSFRTVSLNGGIGNALNAPDNLNAGNSWSPRMKLRFAPLAGTEQYAPADALDLLTASVRGKANTATTLAGYGITDALSQDEFNAMLAYLVSKEIFDLKTSELETRISALEGVELSNYLPISGGTLTGALTVGSLTIDSNGGFNDNSGGSRLTWRIIGDAARGGATLSFSGAHYNFPDSNGDFTVATLEDLEEYAKKSDISGDSGSSSSGGHGLDVDSMTTETSSEWQYDETTGGYSTAVFNLASTDGYISCTATQNSESGTENKVHLQFSLGTADGGFAVVCEDSANGYGDMASIFVPVASGTFYLINATSNEPATITVKFIPLKSSAGA